MQPAEPPPSPRIAGGRCRACGFVFAPMQAFGCERCGAYGEQLEPVSLAAAGRLCSSAVVYLHRKPEPPTPFTVVEVELDDGPTVRALAAADLPGALTPGQRMQGCARTAEEDAPFRFTPITPAPEAST